MEQIELAADSELGQAMMGEQKPASMEEFRLSVPFTTYKDYEPCLNQKKEDCLPAKPLAWAHTSGRTGLFKWAPYTLETLNRLADDTLAAFILASATRKGDVQIAEGQKVVLNLPPIPYMTGLMGLVASQRIRYEAIPPLDKASEMDFEERIRQSFQMALYKGIDHAASIAVVLAKVGESFSQLGSIKKRRLPTWHPLAILRMGKAIIKSKLTGNPILPKDIWTVKGLVCGGTDTAIYRDKIYYYWGVQPLDVYVSTETCFIAMQNWNKKSMSFIPYSNFYEFIPEDEWLKSRENNEYQPKTVLLDEVEAGKLYEIVITNFHGGAFLRYRIGDLIKITALSDEETGTELPQMVFQSRADDVIDIAGFARLDEKTIWQAINNIGIPYTEWSARKEQNQGKSMLNIYLELTDSRIVRQYEIEQMIDQQLILLDNDYRDLRNITGTEQLLVTLIKPGSYQEYQRKKQEAGYDLAHLKPPHVNASDEIINELLQQNHLD